MLASANAEQNILWRCRRSHLVWWFVARSLYRHKTQNANALPCCKCVTFSTPLPTNWCLGLVVWRCSGVSRVYENQGFKSPIHNSKPQVPIRGDLKDRDTNGSAPWSSETSCPKTVGGGGGQLSVCLRGASQICPHNGHENRAGLARMRQRRICSSGVLPVAKTLATDIGRKPSCGFLNPPACRVTAPSA